MFHLTRLTINGFRGFTDERVFTFDEPVVLLVGENHRGKSSALNAVEWCLFGDDCVGKKSGIRERLDWEVANRQAADGAVAVEAQFSGPDGSYSVRRELDGSKRRSGGTLMVVLPDGTRLQGEAAAGRLPALFRTSFRDFMTTVYQHQETVRAILTNEARERNDAIDRLLGLSEYRELLRGIRLADVEKGQRSMEGAFEGLRIRAEQSIRTFENLIREEKAKAMAQGLRPEEITEQAALSMAGEIAEAIRSLARDLEVPELQVASPQRYEEIETFRQWAKDQLDSLWAQAPDVVRQEALAKKQQELGKLSGQYEATREREAQARQELETFIRQNGDATALAQRLRERKGKVDELDTRIREMDKRAGLVREAVEYLKTAAPDAASRCPLCGSQAPQLLAHLESEWEQTLSQEIEELARQRETHAFQIDGIQSLRTQLEKLEKGVRDAASEVAGWLGQVGRALGREIVGRVDDPAALMRARLAEIDADLERIGKAIEQKRQRISGSGGIYDQLAKLRTIDEIIRYEQKRRFVERIWESPEVAQLNELRGEAAQLVEDVQVIRSSLATVSREEAQDKIQAAGASLSEYFRRMADHPAISGLMIEVTEDVRSGLNSYSFKTTDGADPTPILSQGDFNCLALSIFLGLARAAGEAQPFGFLMLDDPAQSLGSATKRRLVGVLEDVASWRKVIIATPDDELRKLLMANVTKSKAVYDFVDWTEQGGPKVVRV
ncbi:MAG: AAA family ATPase [Chloroflexi bacterium]|nr:AAA family ATPase [Chloroflexota bacterium]